MSLNIASQESESPASMYSEQNAENTILSSKQEIENVIKEIDEAQKQLIDPQKVVAALAEPVARGKKARISNEKYISGLEDLLSSLRAEVDANSPVYADTSEYSELMSDIRPQLSRRIQLIENEVQSAEDEFSKTQKILQESFDRLENNQSIIRSVSETIDRLKDRKKDREDRIKCAKAAILFRKIPREIWDDILELVIQAELDDYLRSGADIAKVAIERRDTSIMLSRVSSYWRFIVRNEPRLRKNLMATSKHPWFYEKIVSIPKMDTPPHMSQSLSHSMEPNANIIDLHALGPVMRAPTSFQPLKVIIFSKWSPDLDIYLPTLQSFPNVESLCINARSLLCTRNQDLSGILPNLVTLSLQYYEHHPMCRINCLFSPMLKELYIRCGSNNDIRLLQDINLPHLQILGVTYPEVKFFERLVAPHLSTLRLYWTVPSTWYTDVPNTSKFPLHTLQLHDWFGFGAVSICQRLLDQSTSVRRLKFVESMVEGEALIKLAQARKEASESRPMEEITLDCVRGISEVQCQRLRLLVERLKVCV